MREVVCPEELLELLNRKLSKHEGCTDCHFHTPRWNVPDEGGCNWHTLGIQCSGKESSACGPTANDIVAQFGQRYNIPEPE